MPYDPTIALKVAQPQFDPATAMQNALALRNAQQTGQLNQLKLQQEQQAMQEAAGLQSYLASADLSKPEGMSGLLKYGTPGATVAKTIAERQAAEALTTQRGEEAKKSKFEAASKRQEFVNQAMQDMAANPSDANITAWAQDSVLQGLFAQDEADSLLQQTLAIPLDQRKSVFTQLGMSGAQKSEAERRAEQTKGEAKQRAETERAHRADEKLAREQEERLAKAAETTGGGKTTVSQEQANYNVNRLLNAANQITSAMTAEEGVQKPGLKEAVVKGTFPSLAGAVQSGQRQIVDAAQTDMLDALLYLSTGAAYNKEQLEGQKKSYLPSFLDKPETVAAKQQRLITLIQDAKTRAGNAWTPDMDKKMDLILSSFKAAGTQPAAGGAGAGAGANVANPYANLSNEQLLQQLSFPQGVR